MEPSESSEQLQTSTDSRDPHESEQQSTVSSQVPSDAVEVVEVAEGKDGRRALMDSGEAKEALLSDISNELNCPMCLGLLDDPRFLSCAGFTQLPFSVFPPLLSSLALSVYFSLLSPSVSLSHSHTHSRPNISSLSLSQACIVSAISACRISTSTSKHRPSPALCAAW